MTAQPPPLDRDHEDASAFLAGRRSLLTMAFLGFGLFTLLAVFFACCTALPAYEWYCGITKSASLAVAFASACVICLYGMWVFAQLSHCGKQLDESGQTLAAAMDRHRVFWTHAPILSLLCFAIFLAFEWHYRSPAPSRSTPPISALGRNGVDA